MRLTIMQVLATPWLGAVLLFGATIVIPGTDRLTKDAAEQERRILSQLTSRVGLEPDLARTCLAGGKRLAGGLHGDLNSRLH